MTANIVSQNVALCRLLSLELSRFGISATVSEHPLSHCNLCLMDAFACRTVPPSHHTALLLLGTAPRELIERAFAHLPLPLPLSDLRRAVTEYLTGSAVARKAETSAPPTARKESEPRLVIHRSNRTATVGDNGPIPLSEIEYKLLCRLEEFGQKPLSHGDVKDILGEATSNKLNVYICFLRRKLETGHLRLIHTVRGQGYTLIPQERKKQ